MRRPSSPTRGGPKTSTPTRAGLCATRTSDTPCTCRHVHTAARARGACTRADVQEQPRACPCHPHPTPPHATPCHPVPPHPMPCHADTVRGRPRGRRPRLATRACRGSRWPTRARTRCCARTGCALSRARNPNLTLTLTLTPTLTLTLTRARARALKNKTLRAHGCAAHPLSQARPVACTLSRTQVRHGHLRHPQHQRRSGHPPC